MTGTPSHQQLSEVVVRLSAGQNPDPAAQRELVGWLQENAPSPVFNLCLATVAATEVGLSNELRQIAALQLKTNVISRFKVAVKPCFDSMRDLLLKALVSPHSGLSNAAASCISSAVKSGGLDTWPSILEDLWAQLQQTDTIGPLTCLRDVCEDCPAELDKPCSADPPVAGLLRGLIALLQREDRVERLELILDSICCLCDAPAESPRECSVIATTLRDQLPSVIVAVNRVTEIASSVSAKGEGLTLCKLVLNSYQCLLAYHSELKESGDLPRILNHVFTAASNPSQDQSIALAACEFWSELVTIDVCVGEIARAPNMLGQLIELLLNRMTLSEEEVAMILDEENKDDLAPAIQYRGSRNKVEGENVEQWTTRKAAALTLDRLAEKLRGEVLSPNGLPEGWFLTQIEERLQGSWEQQEAAVLALGAISNGVSEAIQPKLPELVQRLFAVAQGVDTYHFLVRSITCWTLCRYEEYIIDHSDYASYFDRYLNILLTMMQDGYRKVQEVAVSSFASFIDRAHMFVANNDYLRNIVGNLSNCFVPGRMTSRNLNMLLDPLGTLVWICREDMNFPDAHQKVFSPLINHIMPGVGDDNPIFPNLMSCLGWCIDGLGKSFSPYLQVVYHRILSCVGNYYKLLADKGEGADATAAMFAFGTAAAMVKALPDELEHQLTNLRLPSTEYSLFHLALLPFQHEKAFDRQFLDSCACFLKACISKYPKSAMVEMVVSCLITSRSITRHVEDDDGCTANICCLFGEIAGALRGGPDDKVWGVIEIMAETCRPIITRTWETGHIPTSCAITIGIFGSVVPHCMTELLPTLFVPTCYYLARSLHTPAKEQACYGVLQML
eukprot:Sspe_Gene.5746::Locus_1909_Transcript_1_1_Confidence_1.000_Length_2563::g.5746::m.5746/K18752/TNPO1, IPO2, KPNB2; transportin-1